MNQELLAVLIFVLQMESGITIDELKENGSKINYPQWVATIGTHGWKNASSLGAADMAALYPLNLTPVRLQGDVHLRRKFFEGYVALADAVIEDANLSKSFSLQVTSLALSRLHVGWFELDKKEKIARYKALWVGFNGSLWKRLGKQEANALKD